MLGLRSTELKPKLLFRDNIFSYHQNYVTLLENWRQLLNSVQHKSLINTQVIISLTTILGENWKKASILPVCSYLIIETSNFVNKFSGFIIGMSRNPVFPLGSSWLVFYPVFFLINIEKNIIIVIFYLFKIINKQNTDILSSNT